MDVNSDQADLALLLQHSDTFPHYTNYQPLDKATRSIRLLQIRHGSDGEIHATIAHASLDDDQIEYEALSYCWGPPTVPKTIHIGREEIRIRSSLYAFLHTLCQNNQVMPIWVDSICINQRDVQERNWQVSMMGDIYRRATQVKSWVGPSDAYSEYAFAYMSCYSKEAFLSSSNSARAKDKALESFQIFLDRPYWRRLWVVQEMALARELLIMCGTRVISWAGLLNAYKQNFSPGHIVYGLSDFKRQGSDEALSFVSDNSASAVGGPAHTDQRSHLVPRSSLLAQMRRFGAQACEDPRDRVFGLLSISENADQIAVDYTKSLADVLLGVILATYHLFLVSRPNIALRDRHVVPRQKLAGFEKMVLDSDFAIFASEVVRCLQPTGLLSKPYDLLCSLSSIEDNLGICPRVYAWEPIHRSDLNDLYFDKPKAVVFDSEDEEILAEGMYAVFQGPIIDKTLVHWRFHEVAPRIIGYLSYETASPGSDLSIRDAFQLLLQMEELQLCSQAFPISNSLSFEGEAWRCEFFLHLSPFAVLAITCTESIHSRPTIDAIKACLRDRRGKYPRPQLCACKVSAELNREAFRAYQRYCDWDEVHAMYDIQQNRAAFLLDPERDGTGSEEDDGHEIEDVTLVL